MIKPLYIYGASGHAKVVIDVAELMNRYEIRGVLDDNPAMKGQRLMGYPILGGREALDMLDPARDAVFIAIGSNSVRRRIGHAVAERGFLLATLVHPAATIARGVAIGDGTVMMAGVVVNPAAEVGPLTILNTCCSVDHDGRLGEAVHISPGVRLAGNVNIGDESWVGIGGSVIEGRTIGRRCIVGGGAVVVDDIPDNTTVVGVPARPIRSRARVLAEHR